MDGRILALNAARRRLPADPRRPDRRALPSHCHLEGGWPGYVAPPIDPARHIKPNPMYLVFFPTAGALDRYLFFWVDPRPQGCPCKVIEGADFDESPLQWDEWRLGEPTSHVIARSTRTPTKFKAFRSELDIPRSGWEILDGVAEVWSTWLAFERHHANASARV